jgi:hypothetical protein
VYDGWFRVLWFPSFCIFVRKVSCVGCTVEDSGVKIIGLSEDFEFRK